MMSLAALMLAIAPSAKKLQSVSMGRELPGQSMQQGHRATGTLPLQSTTDAYPWVPYADDAPLLDAHDFTRWCNSIGETSDLGRVALHQLAVEYCCQEMAGKVRPPEINKLFPHIKTSGWQSYRGGYVNNTRPTLYRINQYALSKG